MSVRTWPAEVSTIAARDAVGHKGTFGRVLVVGGSCENGRVMLGGPCLSARAALRTGCGLAELALPAPLIVGGLTIVPSATGHALDVDASGAVMQESAEQAARLPADAVVLGPGLGRGHGARRLVAEFLRTTAGLVVDADAINAIADDPSLAAIAIARTACTVVTPHVAEAQRLAASLGVEPTAHALAKATGACVVVKSHETCIACGGDRWSVRAGCANLATGGTGDVLAGLVAGLIAQFAATTSSFDLARQAVCLHGLAARAWEVQRGSAGLLAQELADLIPTELDRWRERRA